MSLVSADDLHLFNEGTHSRLYRSFGAHPVDGGVHFAVWAPNARRVSVIGDFNGWNDREHVLEPQGHSGVWAGVAAPARIGHKYKYAIESRAGGYRVEKADPVGFLHETPPNTASIVADRAFSWTDGDWMDGRGPRMALDAPVSIYEVHVGSWRPGAHYRRTADELADYCTRMGFTHVELMPVLEHPFYGSWGYQVTGYFAPTHRYGGPADFKYLVDRLHRAGVGVVLDWVPAHFPTDEHGLGFFDGTHLYEHADPRKGFHPDWTTFVFNYGRPEVQSFLLSSALFWLDEYHVDALRVDGVASMLYLDYSRADGEWIPNEDGGNDNREAIAFLRRFNEAVYREYPDVQTIAEESTAWPGVSRPTSGGGLGFGYKWDLGWMHDTLAYFERDAVHRSHHQDQLTFRAVYAFSENYVLPLSHDEVVHGKGALLRKMAGDDWQRFANLRLLYSYMFGLPGKKLLFMGAELGVWHEWNHDFPVDWSLESEPWHAGVQALVAELNRLYRTEPALHRRDVDSAGFEWLDTADAAQSVLSWLRHGRDGDPSVLVVGNFTPVPRHDYRIGVPAAGDWRLLFNGDETRYGGSGVAAVGPAGVVEAEEVSAHGHQRSIAVSLPPLACLMLRAPSA